MRLIIDMDETLVSFLPELVRQYNAEYGFNLKVEDIKTWSMDGYPGIHDIYKRPNFFRDLTPSPMATTVMKELWDAGHDLIIATDAQCCPEIIKGKVEWIQNYLPFFPLSHVVFGARKDILRGDLIFDDAPHYLSTFPGITVAMDRPYNRNIKVNHRLLSFDAFIYLINMLEAKR